MKRIQPGGKVAGNFDINNYYIDNIANPSLLQSLVSKNYADLGGLPGAVGIAGPAGVRGLTGYTGLTGATGATGAAGVSEYAATPFQPVSDSGWFIPTGDYTGTKTLTGGVGGNISIVINKTIGGEITSLKFSGVEMIVEDPYNSSVVFPGKYGNGKGIQMACFDLTSAGAWNPTQGGSYYGMVPHCLAASDIVSGEYSGGYYTCCRMYNFNDGAYVGPINVAYPMDYYLEQYVKVYTDAPERIRITYVVHNRESGTRFVAFAPVVTMLAAYAYVYVPPETNWWGLYVPESTEYSSGTASGTAWTNALASLLNSSALPGRTYPNSIFFYSPHNPEGWQSATLGSGYTYFGVTQYCNHSDIYDTYSTWTDESVAVHFNPGASALDDVVCLEPFIYRSFSYGQKITMDTWYFVGNYSTARTSIYPMRGYAAPSYLF
jgi:hypothetical protein